MSKQRRCTLETWSSFSLAKHKERGSRNDDQIQLLQSFGMACVCCMVQLFKLFGKFIENEGKKARLLSLFCGCHPNRTRIIFICNFCIFPQKRDVVACYVPCVYAYVTAVWEQNISTFDAIWPFIIKQHDLIVMGVIRSNLVRIWMISNHFLALCRASKFKAQWYLLRQCLNARNGSIFMINGPNHNWRLWDIA